MSPFAIVPIRSFRLGKSRLAPHLTEERRRALATSLAAKVTEAAVVAGMTPLVITADDEVAAWAAEFGHRVVPDPGGGLDEACRAGVSASGRDRWVVVHSDLPLIAAEDLVAVADLVAAGRDVIAPSSDGGTSVLSSAGTMAFSYGPGSFHRHLARLTDPVIVVRTGLLHDLDTPRDFESATRLGALR
ncbi:MAG TPA: 2-phospho-L-lactate guanylyltransferase [Acidimicrobiia bacterium]